MTSKLKILATTSCISVAIMGANPAFAAGTASGSSIVNNVTVNYQVGGVAQTAETDSDTFVVDRKIDLTVAASDSATTPVSPGQSTSAGPPPTVGGVTTFTVTNTSNATLDFALSSEQSANNFNTPGTDDFDTTGVLIFVEDGTTPGYQAAEDTATFINALGADLSATVYVIADIPSSQVTGDTSGIILTATAHESTTAALDAIVTETVGANTSGVDTVFADSDGPGAEGTEDGAHSAGDDYTVSAADISVFKTSRVVSDPVNGTTDPKAIPGATVEYCISVANAAGSATATNVTISDTLPADTPAGGVTFVPGSILVDATVTSPGASQTCSGGSAGGSFADPVVSGTLSDIAASASRALIFRVVVD